MMGHEAQQRVGIHGLDQMRIESGRTASLGIMLLSATRHSDESHPAAPAGPTDAPAHFVPAQFWCGEIDDEHARVKLLGLLQRGISVEYHPDVEPYRLQQKRRRLSGGDVVIHHQ